MTSTTPAAPPRPQAAPPPGFTEPRTDIAPTRGPALRVIYGAAHIMALGVFGPIVLTLLAVLLSVGIGMLPVLLLGIIPLIGFAFALFAVGWFEAARVSGLLGVELPPRTLRTSGRPGFGGVLRSFWMMLTDPNAWRGVASMALSTVFGVFALMSVSVLVSSVVAAFAPLFATSSSIRISSTGLAVPIEWATLTGILGIVLSLAIIVGLAVLHDVVIRAIMIPSREQQLVDEARTSHEQRAGAVRAAEVERTRIERDLHDGVQPRLVSVGMTLGLAQQKVESDPAAAKELISEAHTSTKAAITELRQLARGIHASVLDDRGLDAALSALAARSHIPVMLDVRLSQRCSRTAEAAVYFSIAETLTNAAKHSRATECRVIVCERDGGTLWARIEDNGLGGAHVIPGSGLDGISNRVLGAGGTFRLDSPAGGPTTVEVSVPCAS